MNKRSTIAALIATIPLGLIFGTLGVSPEASLKEFLWMSVGCCITLALGVVAVAVWKWQD